MNPPLRVILLCVLLAGCGGAPDPWVVQDLGTDAEFRDIFFLDPQRGWIVGGSHKIDGGIVGSTVDGGRTWRFQSGLVRTSAGVFLFHLNAVQFLDEQTGVIVGDGGVILRTIDGGEHWHPVHRGSRVSAHLFDLHFVDEHYGWAVGGSILLRTLDGGQKWSPAIPMDADHSFSGRVIHFLDRERGWSVGHFGRISRTTDGGATWVSVGGPPASGRPDLAALDFLDAEHGWAVGENGTIKHTTDGGQTWSRQTSGTNAYLTGVRFVDASRGWAVGFERADGSSTVLQTADGGTTWTPQLRVEGEELRALYFTDPGHGWAVGDRVRRRPQKLLRYEEPPGAESRPTTPVRPGPP